MLGKVQAIRNPDGHWINTEVFREEATHFKKYGYYCPDPWNSPGWKEYWEEQLKRTSYKGYSIGGARITGDHYFYLNFCPILKVDVFSNKKNQGKSEGFPDFWDGDYNYFWSIDIAKNGVLECGITNQEEYEYITKLDTLEKAQELVKLLEGLYLEVKIHPDYLLGGYHVVVGKSRRKGYSYKNAAKLANKYNNTRNSLSIVGAFDKKYLYPKGTMGMASAYLNFLNEHTGWRKSRDFVDKQDHRKASFSETLNGVPIEKGYKSEIIALTFKDNPDAARGKDAQLFLFEEAGAFPNLKSSFMATAPALKAGTYVTGQIIIFGTGGDMDGGTVDFADMFYDPKPYDLMPFINIWDENAENTSCGFFHPVYWNMEGFYDEQGNSDVKGALEEEERKREKIRKESANASAILQDHVQEWCTNPSEAFLTVSINDFPIQELRNQLNKIIREKLHFKKGQPVTLYRESKTGKVRAKPDLVSELVPVYHYKPKVKDLSGCPVIYEYPVENPPRGLYKAGYDPYRQQQSIGPSLGAFYVYKANAKFSFTRDQIVAEYVGRPSTSDKFNRNVEMLSELYNLELMHENEVTEVVSYFRRRKKLNLLAAQPDEVISKNIKNSKVARVYGIHMNEKLKDAGEKYIKRWLLTERDIDENGNKILNLETLNSPGLIEELIAYDRKKGNFDRVMAFMMVMFQLEEDELGKEYKENPASNAKDLLALIPKMYGGSQGKTLIL